MTHSVKLNLYVKSLAYKLLLDSYKPYTLKFQSFRTKIITFFFYKYIIDRIQTVSRRSKPNSRTTLIGEQPNP